MGSTAVLLRENPQCSRKDYWDAICVAKGGVTDGKYKAFTELHVKVDTEEQKNDLY